MRRFSDIVQTWAGYALFAVILFSIGATVVDWAFPDLFKAEAMQVKKSRSGICHCPGGSYYEKTKNFTAFPTVDLCLKSGGRHPKRGQGDCSLAIPNSVKMLNETKRARDRQDANPTNKRRDLERGRVVPQEPIGNPIQSVQVIDGDTIKLNGETIRLKGIDAPELNQMCRDRGGKTQPCGQFARVFLMELLADESQVHCDLDKERDRYGRALGTCYIRMDVNARMVSMGLALAYRQYSKKYIAEEEKARAIRRAMHQGTFVAPWEWRRGKRLP